MMTSSSAADDVTDDVSNLASFRHLFATFVENTAAAVL